MGKRLILLLAIILGVTGSCKQKTTGTQQPETAVQTTPDYQKMILARVYIKSGSEDLFIESARTIIEKSNSEEGCLSYMLFQDPYEKTNFIFVEKWKNQAAIDYHFGTEHFKEFGTRIAEMTSKPTEIKIIVIAAEK
jgi:quinol monooxygenase YgiN